MTRIEKSAVKFLWLSAVYLAGGAAMAQPAASASGTTPTSNPGLRPLTSATRPSSLQPGRLTSRFAAFAGSEANAMALVFGLRNGVAVSLEAASGADAGNSDSDGAVTITPPTTAMGWSDVRHALDSARVELAAKGVLSPDPEQIKVALLGGTLSGNGGGTGGTGMTPRLDGVLALRSQGLDWDKIDKALGIRSGSNEHHSTAWSPGIQQRLAAVSDRRASAFSS